MSRPLSVQGERVVEAIGAGRMLRRRSGGWAAGGLVAPDSLVADLERRGMVRRAGEGLALGDAGLAWYRRREEPRPNHLLTERALPQDGEKDGKRRRPKGRSVMVNLAESPLGWLKARGLVDDRQFEAGERLRGDWRAAGMAPRATTARGAPDALDPTLGQIAAKRRMEAALEAVGPGLRDVLWRIVCAGEGMETAERALGWPARAGRVVLTLALDRLADFYRLR